MKRVKKYFTTGDIARYCEIEVSLVDKPKRENFLSSYLSKIKNSYDYVFIDSPPSTSVLKINSLNAADGLLIPMQMEVLTLQGLIQLLSTIDEFKQVFNKRLFVKGIVALKYDVRRKLSGEIFGRIKTHIDEAKFKKVIRENVRIAEALSFAQSVIHYAPRSHGAQDYMALAREFIKQE